MRAADTGNPPRCVRTGRAPPPGALLTPPAAQLRLVSAGGLTDEVGERVDETRRVRPAALHGRVGDGTAVAELRQGVVDAQRGAPAVEAHAQFGVAQPAE